MECKKCKKEIPEGAPFCCWCGKAQERKAEVTRRRARGSGTIYIDKRNHKAPYCVRACPAIKGAPGKYLGAFKTRREAQKVLEEYEAGKRPDLHSATVAEVYELWNAAHFETISKSGIDGYKAAFKSISEIHGLRMRELKTADIQICIDSAVAQGFSRSKCEKIRQLCSQLCKYAMQNDLIDKNYAEFVKLPKQKAKEKQIFTKQDRDTLWAHSSDTIVQVILVMIYTGFRIGEITALRPEDIFINEGYMVGGEKTEAGKNRVVPFPPNVPEIKAFVSQWLSECGGDTILGVSSEYFRKYMFYPKLAELGMIDPPIKSKPGLDKNGKSKPIKLLYKDPRLTPHSTRHTFASLSASAGMRPDDLQRIIGHADYETTADIYVHKDIDRLIEAMRKLEK